MEKDLCGSHYIYAHTHIFIHNTRAHTHACTLPNVILLSRSQNQLRKNQLTRVSRSQRARSQHNVLHDYKAVTCRKLVCKNGGRAYRGYWRQTIPMRLQIPAIFMTQWLMLTTNEKRKKRNGENVRKRNETSSLPGNNACLPAQSPAFIVTLGDRCAIVTKRNKNRAPVCTTSLHTGVSTDQLSL